MRRNDLFYEIQVYLTKKYIAIFHKQINYKSYNTKNETKRNDATNLTNISYRLSLLLPFRLVKWVACSVAAP